MKTVELYTEETLFRLEKKYKTAKTALMIFIAAALVACVVLVAFTTKYNEGTTRPVILAVSGVCGSVAIYAGAFPVLGTKRTLEHSRVMMKDERESVEGAADVAKKSFKIRGSVEVNAVTVTNGGGAQRVRVDADLADRIPKDGAPRTYFVVHGFVVAYGEDEE